MTNGTVRLDQTSVTATVSALDGKGNPEAIKDVPVWVLDVHTFASVAPAPDGLTAVFTPIAVGNSIVTVTSSGVPKTATLSVTAGVITSLVISFASAV